MGDQQTNVFFILIFILLSGCEPDADGNFVDNPLIGLWEEAVNPLNWDDPEYQQNCEGPDGTFWARWTFKTDGYHYLEFVAGTITGGVNGYSYGTYQLIADTTLIVESESYENLQYAFIAAVETFYVEITDTTFTSSVSIAPELTCKRYWVRMK